MSLSRDAGRHLRVSRKLQKCYLQEGEHGPALRFMSRRNPHNPGGGEMRLYLRLQVEERALKVWGSEVRYAISCFFYTRTVPRVWHFSDFIFEYSWNGGFHLSKNSWRKVMRVRYLCRSCVMEKGTGTFLVPSTHCNRPFLSTFY
jgi:hypothetical protein